MRRTSWIYGLAYTAAFLTAFILTGMGMWNDLVAKPGDPTVVGLLVMMSMGFSVFCYGLYQERQKVWAYVARRLEVRTRFTRRRVRLHPAPRRYRALQPVLQRAAQ